MQTPDRRDRLTRALLLVVLAAAVVTAPVFLVAEEFDREHVMRVLESNGVTALLCVVLLAALRLRRSAWIERALVGGLFALVAGLAWTNGEPVHTNVINFVFVTVLAHALLRRGEFLAVAAFSAALLCAIALKQPLPPGVADPFEARLEPIGQFLPTFAVTVVILALSRRRDAAREPEVSRGP